MTISQPFTTLNFAIASQSRIDEFEFKTDKRQFQTFKVSPSSNRAK